MVQTSGMLEAWKNRRGRQQCLSNLSNLIPEQRKLAWEPQVGRLPRRKSMGRFARRIICVRAVMPIMKKQSQGSIVNMIRDLVERPIVPYHEYNTAKTALLGYSRNLAAELGSLWDQGELRLAPGLVYPTDASVATKEELKELIIARDPIKQNRYPLRISPGPVMFLASDWSGFMTGQTLYVDGGFVM